MKHTACFPTHPAASCHPVLVILQVLHAHGFQQQAIEALGKRTLAAMLLQLHEIHNQVCSTAAAQSLC